MPLPPAPDHMWAYRNQTITNFGYDTETTVKYRFNGLGYRSDVEFIDRGDPIIVLGNTISFGLGLPVEQTFAGILNKTLNHPVYNFAWGCRAHTNHDQLQLLTDILESLNPRHVIFQINNLNRLHAGDQVSFDNPHDIVVAEFEKFLTAITDVLQTVPHSFLHWDNQDHGVNLPKCVVLNKYHVDRSLTSNPGTFGSKSHRLIALKILQKGI